jgi:hypothetical protein
MRIRPLCSASSNIFRHSSAVLHIGFSLYAPLTKMMSCPQGCELTRERACPYPMLSLSIRNGAHSVTACIYSTFQQLRLENHLLGYTQHRLPDRRVVLSTPNVTNAFLAATRKQTHRRKQTGHHIPCQRPISLQTLLPLLCSEQLPRLQQLQGGTSPA